MIYQSLPIVTTDQRIARLTKRRAIMVVRVCPLDTSKKGGEGQMYIEISITVSGGLIWYLMWIRRKRR